MAKSSEPERMIRHASENLKAAAEDFKAAASERFQDLREITDKKTGKLRKATEHRVQEMSSAAGDVWSDAASKGQDWFSEAEIFVRENPVRAAIIGLGVVIIVVIALRSLGRRRRLPR